MNVYIEDVIEDVEYWFKDTLEEFEELCETDVYQLSRQIKRLERSMDNLENKISELTKCHI